MCVAHLRTTCDTVSVNWPAVGISLNFFKRPEMTAAYHKVLTRVKSVVGGNGTYFAKRRYRDTW